VTQRLLVTFESKIRKSLNRPGHLPAENRPARQEAASEKGGPRPRDFPPGNDLAQGGPRFFLAFLGPKTVPKSPPAPSRSPPGTSQRIRPYRQVLAFPGRGAPFQRPQNSKILYFAQEWGIGRNGGTLMVLIVG
jgi:hypothetical protein